MNKMNRAKRFIRKLEEQRDRPKNGDELDALIKQGKVPNDTGAVFSGKEFEEVENITPEGDLIHYKTGKPVKSRVSGISVSNGAPRQWLDKPIKFLGRKIWAFAGRGNAYEVEVDGQYGILSQFSRSEGKIEEQKNISNLIAKVITKGFDQINIDLNRLKTGSEEDWEYSANQDKVYKALAAGITLVLDKNKIHKFGFINEFDPNLIGEE